MKHAAFFCVLLLLGSLLYGQGWDAEAHYAGRLREMQEMAEYLEEWDASFEAAEADYEELERRYGSDAQKQEDLRYYKHIVTHIGVYRTLLGSFPEMATMVRRDEERRGIVSLTDERAKALLTVGEWNSYRLGFYALLPAFERAAGEMRALLAEK
jgi:hypothetical protein